MKGKDRDEGERERSKPIDKVPDNCIANSLGSESLHRGSNNTNNLLLLFHH